MSIMEVKGKKIIMIGSIILYQNRVYMTSTRMMILHRLILLKSMMTMRMRKSRRIKRSLAI